MLTLNRVLTIVILIFLQLGICTLFFNHPLWGHPESLSPLYEMIPGLSFMGHISRWGNFNYSDQYPNAINPLVLYINKLVEQKPFLQQKKIMNFYLSKISKL